MMLDDKGRNLKQIIIDFLYLDLNVCDRCIGSNFILDEAIHDVSNLLEKEGIKVVVNKVNVHSEFLAYKYKFISSPTIRVNGQDIQMDIKENNCESCGTLCGSQVDCRIWLYNGKEYTTLPKELIVEEIMNEVYGNRKHEANIHYELPENLKKFYSLKRNKSIKIGKWHFKK